MNILLILVVVVLLFGGLGYGFGLHNNWPGGGAGFGGTFGVILIVLLAVFLFRGGL